MGEPGRARTGAEDREARRLRWRLTAVGTVLTAVMLVATAAGLVVWFRMGLERNTDDLLVARVRDLAQQVQRGDLGRTISGVGEESMAQVIAGEGRVLAASTNLGAAPAIAAPRLTPGDVQRLELEAPDDDETEHYRTWALGTHTSDGRPAVVLVGTTHEAIDETVGALAFRLAVGFPALLAASALLLWVVVGHTMRPVAEAHARQRRFVADAAHELQGPLAALRSQLEVGEQDPRPLLDDTDRMERLVRDLLFLARAEEGHRTPPRSLDLDDVVLEETARARTTAPVRFDVSGVSAAPVLGHREDLARLVRNLLSNAARHAATTVTVAAATRPRAIVELTVSDDGPGVPVDQRNQVFQRFWRGDEARSPDSGSTGLGLSIVRTIAEQHGGSVELVGDTGAVFVVRLPMA